jgi:hypothetical protein
VEVFKVEVSGFRVEQFLTVSNSTTSSWVHIRSSGDEVSGWKYFRVEAFFKVEGFRVQGRAVLTVSKQRPSFWAFIRILGEFPG